MTDAGSPDPLAAVRSRRDELYEAMLALERAMSVPARDRADAWTAAVRDRLDELAAAWRVHLAGTEDEDGLFAQILDHEPRLAHAVGRMRSDHVGLSDAFDAADAELAGATNEASVDDLRDTLLDLLRRLFEHRSRGAELVYDAYDVDLSAAD